jgi:hypothetical protein
LASLMGNKVFKPKSSPMTSTLISFVALYFDEIVLDLYDNISVSHLTTPLNKNKKKCIATKFFQL